MPSPYSKLEVPLGLGLQTDIDDKLLPAGKVVELQNGVWQRTGEIVKRNGTVSLGLQYAGTAPGSMPAPWQLATHKGALVTLSKAGPRPLGVYSPAVGKWIAPAGSSAIDNINGVASKLRGQVLPRRGTVYRSNAIGASGTVVQAPDEATNGTYTLVCWNDTDTGASTTTIKAQLVEVATGKTLFTYSRSSTYIGSGNGNCRAVFVNGEFQLIFIDGANVKLVSWSVSGIAAGNGFQASGEFALAADATLPYFDAIIRGTDLMLIYRGATSRIIRRDSAGVVTASALTAGGGGAVSDGPHAWVRDLGGSGKLAAQTVNSGIGVRVHWDINPATGATVTTYLVDATLGLSYYNLAAHTVTSSATGDFVALWHTSGGTNPISWGRRTAAGVISSGAWILRAMLASTTFVHLEAGGSTSSFYVLIAYDSDEQGTLFAIRVPTNFTDATDANRTPAARFCTGSASKPASFTPPSVTALGADSFLAAANVRVRQVKIGQGGGGQAPFDTGVDTVTLTFNPTNVNGAREFADNLYTCGGILGAFDGVTFAEEGFHLFPEQPTVVQQVGGNLAALGNYVVCALYRYTDAYGRIRRSTPSDPTATIALTAGNRGLQISARTLKLHGRPDRVNDGGKPGSVAVEFYATTNNETDTFSLVGVVQNDESVDTVTFTLTADDTTIAGGEDLYTGTPGENATLANAPPPPALSTWAYKDRLAVIPADDPTLVMISLPLGSTEGPRFHDVSSIRIEDGNGDLRVGAAADDRAIVFKDNAVYAIPGDGPDVAGNGTFGIAQIIASGIGCSEPRSVVQVPDGVMFRSASTRAGIFLVNRGLAVDYVGAAVQKYLTPGVAIVDAVHLPQLLRTEFFTNVGLVLVYDHATKLWGTYTNETAFAATAWNGRHVMSQSASILFVSAEADDSIHTFDDTSSPVEMYAESPWLSLAALKGYFRFKRVQLVGEKRVDGDASGGYKVTVTIWKDFDLSAPLVQEARDMDQADDINAVELRYSAKVSALKVGVRISQKTGDGTNFPGPKLSALTIVYLTKEGLRKTASGNRLA